MLAFRKDYRYKFRLDVVWMMGHTIGYVDGTLESGTQSDKAARS
ncbi:MAG: hypothetical protein WBX22_03875 [Silvibacterium sp.]